MYLNKYIKDFLCEILKNDQQVKDLIIRDNVKYDSYSIDSLEINHEDIKQSLYILTHRFKEKSFIDNKYRVFSFPQAIYLKDVFDSDEDFKIFENIVKYVKI